MTGHGTLAVEVGKMDLALEDVRVNFMLLSSAEKDPTLVGSLVAMGISAINGGIIYRGLFRHAWNDAQLAEIDEKLRSVDFLEDFQSVLRAESAMSANDLPYFKRTSGKDLMSWAGSPAMEGLALGPKGWWNINAAQIVDLHFEQMEQVDLSKRIVLVKKAKAMKARMDAFCDSWQGTCLPWNAWYSVSGGAETNITKRFARAQVWVDEMRIAIALERYRLAQGALPAKLEMLAPQYLDAVPHDIMDGNPYHYVLNADGTYLLYSIGWNELDEGGVVVYESENPKAIDENEGDWVWPMPKK
jgi:hypothetical protein